MAGTDLPIGDGLTCTVSASLTATPTNSATGSKTASATVTPSVTGSTTETAAATASAVATASPSVSGSNSVSPTAAWYTSLAAVTVLAGGGASNTASGCANGVGTNALFANLRGQIAVDSADRAYICDGTIVRVLNIATQAVTTLAGGGSACGRARGYANGIGSAALFSDLSGVAVDDTRGALYVFDEGNKLIRVVDVATQSVTLLAGTVGNYINDMGSDYNSCNGAGSAKGCHTDGYGTSAAFKYPAGGAFDANGRLFFGDYGNEVIQYIDVDSRLVQTFSWYQGLYWFDYNADGVGSNARFHGMSWNCRAEGVSFLIW